MNTEWEQLFTDVQMQTGMMDADYDIEKTNTTVFEEKVVVEGQPKHGAKVEVCWGGEYEGIVDHGYIFTMPGFDSGDIWMSGIVHLTEPYVEKEKSEPEWYTIDRLLLNPIISKIIIKE